MDGEENGGGQVQRACENAIPEGASSQHLPSEKHTPGPLMGSYPESVLDVLAEVMACLPEVAPVEVRPVLAKSVFSGDRFLHGPIPLPWLFRAAVVGSGAVLAVVSALWWRHGYNRRRLSGIEFPSGVLRDAGFDRHAHRRARRALEEAGLVKATRIRGRGWVYDILLTPDEMAIYTRQARPGPDGR